MANIDDLKDSSGELSESEAASVSGGRFAPVQGGGGDKTQTIIDTIYSNGTHRDDLIDGD